jgi:hypothetical protein
LFLIKISTSVQRYIFFKSTNIIRNISAATARASFTLLLQRMTKVGEGARKAEGRRGLERMEEEMMMREREAQWLARVRGVGLVHRGRFFV